VLRKTFIRNKSLRSERKKERIKEREVETGVTQLGEKEREQEEGKKGR